MNAAVSQISDGELMKRLGEGDIRALGDLYLRHGHLVAGAVSATTGTFSASEVDDLRQEVFMAVRDSAKKYRDDGRFRSWLYSVAVRTAKDRCRTRENRKRLLRNRTGELFAIGSASASPEVHAMLHLDVARAFRLLPDVQREALFLFEHMGMSGEEIAGIMDIQLNTVWSHLRRARVAILASMNDAKWEAGSQVP